MQRKRHKAAAPRAYFSHTGFYVNDIELMTTFYCKLLGLEITDRATLKAFPGEPKIVFLSSDPEEHHQIVLIEGRSHGTGREPMIQQISFRVESLADLRTMKVAVEESGITDIKFMNHGTSWSIYFADPDDNTIECFVDAPWHVRQPVTEALDLSLSDEEILAQTEAAYTNEPDFQSRQDWKESFAQRLAERWR